MKKKKLKLYVWEDFNPDWSSGLAFAIASSEKEAKDLILLDVVEPAEWGKVTVHNLSKKIARSVSGGG